MNSFAAKNQYIERNIVEVLVLPTQLPSKSEESDDEDSDAVGIAGNTSDVEKTTSGTRQKVSLFCSCICVPMLHI